MCAVSSNTSNHYARFSSVEIGIGMSMALSPADDTVIDDPGLFNVCYDGKHFWARGIRESGGVARHAIFKIDLNKVCRVGETILDNDFDTVSWAAFDINSGNTHSTGVSVLKKMKLVSDGRDIWFPGHLDAGDDLSGIIFRLPKTALR